MGIQIETFLGDRIGWDEILNVVEELNIVPDEIDMQLIFGKYNRGN